MRLIDADAIPWTDLNDNNPNSDLKVLVTFADKINMMPTIEERKTGEWTEKEVIYKDEASKVIEEWQSARCSNCGLYHTTPYAYYFDNFNYCPNCGANMRGTSA